MTANLMESVPCGPVRHDAYAPPQGPDQLPFLHIKAAHHSADSPLLAQACTACSIPLRTLTRMPVLPSYFVSSSPARSSAKLMSTFFACGAGHRLRAEPEVPRVRQQLHPELRLPRARADSWQRSQRAPRLRRAVRRRAAAGQSHAGHVHADDGPVLVSSCFGYRH